MSVNTKVNGQLVKSAGLYKASVPIQSGDIYSFEERQIGVFADGKPLYQKTLYIASLPSSKSTGTYSLNVSNAENCWVVDANSGTGNLNMIRIAEANVNDMQSVSIYARCGVVDGDIKVYVEVGRDRSSMSAYVTVRYTKTTDVAGSGEYVPSGDKAVHYSTEEQVIGTWTDGSTLYEKTVRTATNASGTVTLWTDSSVIVRNYSGCFVFRATENTTSLFSKPTDSNYRMFCNGVGNSEQYGVYAEVELGSQRGNIADISLTVRYTKTS